MVHGLLADANTMVMVVATTNLWLTKGDDTCSKATQDQDKVDNWTWQKTMCVTQIEAHHCGLESLYPVFKDASIKRFVEQNSANSLCFVRCFFLAGGEGSIAVS